MPCIARARAHTHTLLSCVHHCTSQYHANLIAIYTRAHTTCTRLFGPPPHSAAPLLHAKNAVFDRLARLDHDAVRQLPSQRLQNTLCDWEHQLSAYTTKSALLGCTVAAAATAAATAMSHDVWQRWLLPAIRKTLTWFSYFCLHSYSIKYVHIFHEYRCGCLSLSPPPLSHILHGRVRTIYWKFSIKTQKKRKWREKKT